MQETIVAIIVAVAIWQVLGRYAPQGVRTAMHRFLLALLRRIGLGSLAARLAEKKRSKGGACGGCRACSSSNGKGAQVSAGAKAAAEPFRISPDAIKRSTQR